MIQLEFNHCYGFSESILNFHWVSDNLNSFSGLNQFKRALRPLCPERPEVDGSFPALRRLRLVRRIVTPLTVLVRVGSPPSDPLSSSSSSFSEVFLFLLNLASIADSSLSAVDVSAGFVGSFRSPTFFSPVCFRSPAVILIP